MVILTQDFVAAATPFPIVTQSAKATIVYSPDAPKLDSISAHLLALDIERITHVKPAVRTHLTGVSGNIIAIGSIHSALVQTLLGSQSMLTGKLTGQWECFGLTVAEKPTPAISKALIIAGSDTRGTAYGVFTMAEKIGISPWFWWADVSPKQQQELRIQQDEYISSPPSVKFRGIFINDEDWGLQPWAANTFEPETADMGPKTYAKIFELLLRLKANLIWPAMHPSTKPFYTIPGNREVADAYQIIVGSSHAEPMLRNNVREWDHKSMGDFNYLTNKSAVYNYWESRVRQAGLTNVMYTIGMRGVHDSGMEGVKTPSEAVPVLEQVFADQRGLFRKFIDPEVTKVPQVFTLYKEVLDVYANGLQVPDDVTLIWPDDNYGYIHQLSNARESRRSGGSGVYYHASYWGRPHDYLWLSTTHPALMREEMTKAYTLDAGQVWVLNVGDIKPGEYDLQLFMDMGYHIEPFLDSRYIKKHLQNWVSQQFGQAFAPAITTNLWAYYQLAFERKPEFMGWSQTEPTTPIKSLTAYNHFFYNDQAQRRLDQYDKLEKTVQVLGEKIPAPQKDAYFQLVEYPIVCASLMNKKFLYRDKALLYAQQGRLSADDYRALSKQAYETIVQKTAFYNDRVASGKWQGIMSMNPRNLPVYDLPPLAFTEKTTNLDWQVVPEGYAKPDSGRATNLALPEFNRWNKQRYFLDVFLSRKTNLSFNVIASADWIKVSKTQGRLSPNEGQNEMRLWVEIDWDKAPKQVLSGSVQVIGGNRTVTIGIKATNAPSPELDQFTGFVESAGFISMNAFSASGLTGGNSTDWKLIDGLGTAGSSLESFPLVPTTPLLDTTKIGSNPSATYPFYTLHTSSATITVYTLPTFPLTSAQELRYAVSVDGAKPTIYNVKTIGRTEEWKQNVLSNATQRTLQFPNLAAGKHTLTIYKIDPGLILDRMFIDLGVGQPHYGAVPETFHRSVK